MFNRLLFSLEKEIIFIFIETDIIYKYIYNDYRLYYNLNIILMAFLQLSN